MAITAMLVYPVIALFLTIVGWPTVAFLNYWVKDVIAVANSFDAWRKLNQLKIEIVPKLKCTLCKAERQKLMEAADGYSPVVKVFDQMIKNLKSALCEAEDTLNLLEYHSFRKNAHELHDKTFQADETEIDSFLSSISRWRFIAKWKLKIRIEKVENIISDVHNSPVHTRVQNDVANTRTDIASGARPKVFGRDMERQTIMDKLYGDAAISTNSPCYSVIGIHGIAGSGKTTLAQYVVDYIKKDEAKPFDPVMCVHVSENSSLNGIYCDMLNKIMVDQNSNIVNRQHLQEELKRKVTDKRFLLVLDDLWVKGNIYHQLDELLSPLNVGMSGSKILVTSQSTDIAGIPCAAELIPITDLDQEKYLEMFMYYAFDGEVVLRERFIPIGEKIVEKLHKSPLAAALVGRQLRMRRNVTFWSTVLELDVLSRTREYLWWSYQRLDVDIRRCFEYCNVFPRHFKLKRDELVRMWVAQGFVCASPTEDMEAVAHRYFHELLACSFLQVKRQQKYERRLDEYG